MTEASAFAPSRKRIWDELVAVHDAWDQYQHLYMESSERVQMLNVCAGWFFGGVQRMLIRTVMLGISRLTDPPRVGRSNNLVLRSFLADAAVDSFPKLRAELEVQIIEAERLSQPIRVHRNKSIAHLDHGVAVNAREALPGVSASAVTEVIRQMEKVYNLHGTRVHESTAFFDVGSTGSAPALTRVLENSERWLKWKALQVRREAQ